VLTSGAAASIVSGVDVSCGRNEAAGVVDKAWQGQLRPPHDGETENRAPGLPPGPGCILFLINCKGLSRSICFKKKRKKRKKTEHQAGSGKFHKQQW
jgi:hypothetical protein